MKKPITYFRERISKDLDFLCFLARYRRYSTEKGKKKIDEYIIKEDRECKKYLNKLIAAEKSEKLK